MRTYQEAAAIRAVTTEDFMTADWARLPLDLLARGVEPGRERGGGNQPRGV
jgi:GMP synthase PP-ATPase subunit